MTHLMKMLIGYKIVKLVKIHDYWQLFTENAVINIYTKYYLKKDGALLDNNKITDFIAGQTIELISLTEQKYLIFSLSNYIDFYISICPEDYVGPEAYCIVFLNSSVIIVG